MDGVSAGFERAYEYPPIGVWSAPGRVNLIGEHSDYNNGLCLPFAIGLRTSVAVGLRADRAIRTFSSADTGAGAGADHEWTRYPLGVAWALLRIHEEQNEDPDGERLHRQLFESVSARDLPGVDLFFESDVPLGAGLSSSAAIEMATAVALNDVWGLGLGGMQLALAGKEAENIAVGAPTGIMDQLASIFGESEHAVLLDCETMTVTPVPLPLAERGLELLVIDTGVKHSNVDGGFARRRAECDEAAAALGVSFLREVSSNRLESTRGALSETLFERARHVVSEIERVRETVGIVDSGELDQIGDVLNRSHASLRDDFEVSCAELNLAVDLAREAGALGARMTGAGFGGSAIALVRSADAAAVRERITAGFAGAGFRAPNIFVALPSAGAGRDDAGS